MEVNFFQILLVDVTFYLSHILNVVLDVLIKNENPNICGTGGQRVKRLVNNNPTLTLVGENDIPSEHEVQQK